MSSAEPDSDTFLEGKLLIAMPGMGDPRFAKSVVFICSHSEDGAMGLIVNKPASELDFTDLLNQLEIPIAPGAEPIGVHFGGPVDNGRGFVLHSGEYDAPDSTLHVNSDFGMTATVEILKDIASGSGPEQSFLALGYAGWGPGQLEGEFRENGWLTCEAASEIVFGADPETKWEAALASMGITPSMLAAAGGSA